MSVRKLIEFFSHGTILPVSPNDVRDQAIDLGVSDRIQFVQAALNPNVLRGFFVSYFEANGVYATPTVCSEIYYDYRQDSSWRRLVCCKELLHLFDSQSQKTHKKEDLQKLVTDMSHGIAGLNLDTWGLHSLVDQVTVLRALAILFPEEAREVLLEPFNAGKITITEIARRADLPPSFVEVLMGTEWPGVYKILIGSC